MFKDKVELSINQDYKKDYNFVCSLFPKRKRVSIFRILGEVNNDVNFIDCFSHISNGKIPKEKDILYFLVACLITASNDTKSNLILTNFNLNQSTLQTVINWYFHSDSFLTIIKMLTEKKYHLLKPYEIVIQSNNYVFNDHNKYFRHPDVICCESKDVAYVIDRLVGNLVLYEPTEIPLPEDYEYFLYGLTDVLGYSYATEIKDINNEKLYLNESDDPKNLIIDGYVDTQVINANWDNMIRLAATIKTNYTPASKLLSMYAYRTDDPVFKGFRELGKMLKTIYLLCYFKNDNLRETVDRHSYNLKLYEKYRKGILKKKIPFLLSKEDKESIEGCTQVVEYCITYWNIKYIDELIKNEIEPIQKVGSNKLLNELFWF